MTSGGVSVNSVRVKVSTGYVRLDEALHGGFLSGSMAVLNAPAGDEAPILVRNFLKSELPSLLICRNLSSAQAIVPDAAEGATCLVCSDKPISPANGILPGKGIENLTDLNLQINEALGAIQPKRVALDILSDILLRHKALQTRKWLNELLERLRSRGITTLAILNPFMHTAEETQALVDMFDASIGIFEREGRKSLRVNWTHGIEVTEREFPLEGLAEKKANNAFDGRRVAVLPFSNMSPDPNDEYFADGMTEELITSLSGVRQLTVIARTSVMKYKGSQKTASDVGKELNAGSLIEGSVRKAGNRVRITAQLIDTSTEGHLWARNYDRQLDDVFAIQSEIAEKVAAELRIRLVDSEKRNLEKKPTENTEAYTYFLQGRELYRKDTAASVAQALSLFEKAVELDPKFAKAYVGVAECHQFLGSGYEPWDVSISAAKASLDRAIDLDPDLPEAHASLAYLHFNKDEVPDCEAEAKRALQLNPNLPEPYAWLSEVAALKGDPEEAVRMNEAAYRLDPIRPMNVYSLGTAYLWTGREQEALEFWKKTEEVAPAFTCRGMTEYYLIKGELAKAEEFCAKAEKLEPTNPRIIWLGGVIAAMEGDREKAQLAIKKIEDLKAGPIGLNFIAYIYHALQDLDSYFECMNKALEAHMLIPSTVMYSPLFAKGRADPRFPETVERLRKQCGLTK
jgi:TolB-like protein/Tfp pilus assembly protein PilF